MKIKATYRPNSDQSELEVLNSFRRPSLLVLDELGKRGQSDWENTLLCELIDCRYRDMRDTILLSNQNQSGFEASVDDSIVSRINETGGIVECTWPSFR
jgi:DNA replication protein DnaC